MRSQNHAALAQTKPTVHGLGWGERENIRSCPTHLDAVRCQPTFCLPSGQQMCPLSCERPQCRVRPATDTASISARFTELSLHLRTRRLPLHPLPFCFCSQLQSIESSIKSFACCQRDPRFPAREHAGAAWQERMGSGCLSFILDAKERKRSRPAFKTTT